MCRPIRAVARRKSLVVESMQGRISAGEGRSQPVSPSLWVRLAPGCRHGAARAAAGEETAAEEGALEGAVPVHPPAAEAGDLAGRVEPGQRLAVGAQHARLEVGLEAAERLAGEDVELHADQR